MVAFSRVITDVGPLQIYLTMCQLDSGRSPEKRLSPQTVSLLASKYSQFNELVPGLLRVSGFER